MTRLSEQMRAAALTLIKVSSLYGYPYPASAAWSPDELLHEANHVEDGDDDES